MTTDPTTSTEYLLGGISAKLDGLSSELRASERRTSDRLDGHARRLDEVVARVDSIESLTDRLRGITTAAKVTWTMAGATVSGVVVAILLRLV